MKYSLNFIIRDDQVNGQGKCPIYLRYSHKSKWINIPLKYSIEPSFWDKENYSVRRKYSNYNELKRLMNDFEGNVRQKVEDYYYENKVYPPKELINNLLQEVKRDEKSIKTPTLKSLYDDFVKFKIGKMVKQSTLNIYKYTWDKWELYEKSTSPKELNEMNERTLSLFNTFLLEQGLQLNTIGKYTKTIKTFLRYVSNHLEMNVPPSFQRVKVEREEKNDFVVFDKEEFERLKREVFYSRYFTENRFDLSEREILIGRIMVFLCSTGLSYVDFDRLTIENLFVDIDILDSKKKYLNIKIHRQKTNIPEVCIIPIIDITIDLVIDMLGLTYEFYEGNDESIDIEFKLKILEKLLRLMKKGRKFTKYQPRLFPKVLQQDFNKEIKLLMCKLGMVNEVKILKQVKNKVVDLNIPKYQLITSHTGRRTYITSCLRQGIRPHILMRTTGHKKIGTLLRYNKETELNIYNEFEDKIKTSLNKGVSK